MKSRANQQEWKALKTRIGPQNSKALIDLIGDLFELSEENRSFLAARYASKKGAPDILKQYKKTITQAINPDFDDPSSRIDLPRAKKAVLDFERASNDPEQNLDLKIHFVEVGTQLANAICVDYDSYYEGLESMFSSVVRMLKGKEKRLAPLFLPRLKKLVKKATDAYGYQDSLEDLLEELAPKGNRQ